MLGDGKDELASSLLAISKTAEIGIPDSIGGYDAHLGDKSPAETLWTLLKGKPGVGPVIAGKLLAAKRPHLVPIYDYVVQSQLRPRNHKFWRDMWGTMELTDVRGDLQAIQSSAAASVPSANALSLLRVLDIVAWREGRRNLS